MLGAQLSRKAASCLTDLLLIAHRPVRIQEQNPDRTSIEPWSVVVVDGPDGQIRDTVPVEVPKASDRPAEAVDIVEVAAEITGGAADLLVILDRSIDVQEENPDRTSVLPPIVVAVCTDRQES